MVCLFIFPLDSSLSSQRWLLRSLGYTTYPSRTRTKRSTTSTRSFLELRKLHYGLQTRRLLNFLRRRGDPSTGTCDYGGLRGPGNSGEGRSEGRRIWKVGYLIPQPINPLSPLCQFVDRPRFHCDFGSLHVSTVPRIRKALG